MEAMTVCAHCGTRTQGRPLICERCGEDPRVQGRYRLEGELGRGGGGVTWRARREPGGEPVCLKELRWATMGSLDDERRFAREGELLEALEHPSIPRHYGAFAWGQGRAHALFIAQELVVGDNLEVERKRRGYRLEEALEAGAELADVLAWLHERHPPVVHRDLKPSNIMRRVDGRLVLIDFGAARLAGIGQSQQVSVAGTFGFMAPEQIRGAAGPSADVYGLGMTLAVLLSGGAPEDLLDGNNRPDFGRIAGLRRDVRALLDEMSAVEASARPSASEVARRCRTLIAGPQRVPQPQPAPPTPTPAAARPSSAARIIPLVMVVTILGAVGFMVMSITNKVTDTVDRAIEAARVPAVTTSVSWTVTSETSTSWSVGDAVVAVVPPPPVAAVDPIKVIADGCADGRADACGELARGVESGGLRQAAVALAGWPAPLVAGCDKQIASACHAAAIVYAQGVGVTASRIETRAYFGKACDAGDMRGCASFGHMLLKGDGGPTDWKAALAPLERACGGGDDDACLSVGAIWAEGKGAKIDRAKALGIFEGLCGKGLRAACENVDAMVGNNWGLPASGAARTEALARLCEGRSGAACVRLGDAYARGSGVKKDAAKAREAFTRGCDVGYQGACDKMR